MPRIKLFLMRHSKSCSNYVRSGSEVDAVGVSQNIRDPGLTERGHAVAANYGPSLKQRLANRGFDVDRAIVCASELRRAQETAKLVFGRFDRVLPYFKEHGAIPENTPEGRAYSAPNWKAFVRELAGQVSDGDSVAVVGHGGFLRSLWPGLTGREKSHLNNLDGVLVDADIDRDGVRVHSAWEFPSERSFGSDDRCGVADTEKIAAIHKRMTRRSQNGGGVNMPLAFFQDGAQMRGTFGEPTGLSVAGGWARAPLNQTGGTRTRRNRRTRRTLRRSRSQKGGFSASIMGPFAVNGARLMPVAAYMGYKMYSGYKGTAKTQKKRKTRRA